MSPSRIKLDVLPAWRDTSLFTERETAVLAVSEAAVRMPLTEDARANLSGAATGARWMPRWRACTRCCAGPRSAKHTDGGRRRGSAGRELDDIAHQTADDAMVSILSKLDIFRGESRFTTWAYRFAVLEVANRIGRQYWHRPTVSLEAEEWERLSERAGLDPLGEVQQQELIDAVRRAVDESLTERQRTVFVAITVNGIPVDAVAAKLDTSRGAIHKTIFDARRKIRQFLTTHGYSEDGTTTGRPARQTMEVKEA